MKIIFSSALLMIHGVMTSMSVTGYSKDGVTKYTPKTKYFCRGQMPDTLQIGWCSDLIRTNEKDKWVHSGRFSLCDDTRSAVFTVTIRDLSELDSGPYQCAVDISREKDFYTEVNVEVITERNTLIIIIIITTTTYFAKFPAINI